MNREIKFRAWHEGLKCMSEVLELDFQHDAIRCVPGHLPKNRMSDCVLMQFTGLRDKNGKEIYEGDIVKSYTGAGDIRFGGYSAGGQDYYASYAYGFYIQRSAAEDDTETLPEVCEVIGNVYENPELLPKP